MTGGYAYVAGGGLRVVDVSNPADPVETGFYAAGGIYEARDVYVAGNYAYLADWYALRVIDISDPAEPKQAGAYAWERGIWSGAYIGVYAADGYAYVATESDGLHVFDVSNPAAPAKVGAYDKVPAGTGVFVTGDYAYVTADDGGLRVVDISVPAMPVEIGVANTPRNDATDVYVAGNYAYVANYDYGLRVVDVSSPTAPLEIGRLGEGFWTAQDVYIAGNYAYVANYGTVLRIVNISNPAALSQVGTYDTSPAAGDDVEVADGYAYVAAGAAGMRVIDVSNPNTPQEVGIYDTDTLDAWGVSVIGDYAYVACAHSGFRVVDISNPTAPVETSVYTDTYWIAAAVYVANDYAYVAGIPQLTGAGDLRMIDISNPSAPVEVASYVLPASPADVYVSRDCIYVADDWGGLFILQFVPSASASISPDGGSLVSPFDNTNYTFPAGTFAHTTTVTHTLLFAEDLPSAGNLVGIQHAYQVSAVDDATGQPVQPSQPYTLTIQYTDAQKGPAIGDTLALYYWDDNQWVEEPSSQVDTLNNTLTAMPDHFSVWAVLGETRRVFLPLILRNY